MDARQGREAQASGGHRRVGALYRCMVATRPGELGGRSRCHERAKRRRRVVNGGAIVVRSQGAKQEIQKRLKQVGREVTRISCNNKSEGD